MKPPEKARARVITGRHALNLEPTSSAIAYHACLPGARIVHLQPASSGQILREIMQLRILQAPFGRIFWSLEQRIARLSDELARRAS